jgi:ATPase subunit of ABC transporter with duplicated ATPase domains
MNTGASGDERLGELLERALQLTEDTLEHIARIAVEQIREGAESSSHIEAAERDVRSALRQLVLAQRESRAKPTAGMSGGDQVKVLTDATTNTSPSRSGPSGSSR